MIKAIPTTYKGVQMRSKLEAKIAAELDGKSRCICSCTECLEYQREHPYGHGKYDCVFGRLGAR